MHTKGPYILNSEVGKSIKEMRDKKATAGDDNAPGMYSYCLEKVVSK
jgi:hypothetical protein